MKSSDQEDDLNIQEIWVNTLTDNHTIYHTTDKEISKFERNSTKNSQTMERIVLKTREGKDSAVMVLYDSGASKTFCSLSLAKAVAEDLREIENPFFACSIAGKIKIEYAAKLRIKITDNTNMILWCFVLPEINQTVPRAELEVPKKVYEHFGLKEDYFNRKRGHLAIIFGSDCQAEFFPTEIKTFGKIAIYKSRLTRHYIAVGAPNKANIQDKESPNLEVMNFIAFMDTPRENMSGTIDKAIKNSQNSITNKITLNQIWENARPVRLDKELISSNKVEGLKIDDIINKEFRSNKQDTDTVINSIYQDSGYNPILRFDINRVSEELKTIHKMSTDEVNEKVMMYNTYCNSIKTTRLTNTTLSENCLLYTSPSPRDS